MSLAALHATPRATGPLLAAALLAGAGLAVGGAPVPQLLVLLLLAPVLEEIVFRAGLQEFLLRRWQAWPAAWANLATAAAFGLAHALLRADALAWAVAIPALLVGAVYQRTRRLRCCIALHAAMNAAWLGWQQIAATTTP